MHGKVLLQTFAVDRPLLLSFWPVIPPLAHRPTGDQRSGLMVAEKLPSVTTFVELARFRQTPEGSGGCDQPRDQRQRGIHFVGLRATGLREVRAAAAAATAELGDGL